MTTIVFHIGMHCTDGGLLLRSLLQNRARLAAEGIAVPGPARYRDMLGRISTSLRGAPAPEVTETFILEAIDTPPGADRIILSNENFLCRSDVALGPDCLYPKAEKSAWLRKCVPSHEVEFALALRNPASFIPDLLSGRGGPAPPERRLRNGIWLDDLRWDRVVETIRQKNPGCRIIAWCHEDTPFTWPDIARELTGAPLDVPLDGELDMAETIMTPEGYDRLSGFLEARRTEGALKRRRAISAFLEAHALPDAIEAEIDLPGWTDETVDTLTAYYEDDVARIADMRNVTFIAP